MATVLTKRLTPSLALRRSMATVIYHHVMNPGEVMVTPPGAFTFERTIGSGNCIGFRAAFLSKNPGNVTQVLSLITMHRASLKSPLEDNLGKFWSSVEAALPKDGQAKAKSGEEDKGKAATAAANPAATPESKPESKPEAKPPSAPSKAESEPDTQAPF